MQSYGGEVKVLEFSFIVHGKNLIVLITITNFKKLQNRLHVYKTIVLLL